MKWLYKYPQAEYPVPPAWSRRTSAAAARAPSSSCSTPASSTTTATSTSSSSTPRQSPDDIVDPHHACTTAGPTTRRCTILPHLWFRNTWAWGAEPPARADDPRSAASAGAADVRQPTARRRSPGPRASSDVPVEYALGPRCLYAPADGRARCSPTTRPTASASTGRTSKNPSPHVKDAFHRYLVDGEPAINPARTGTKAAPASPAWCPPAAASPCTSGSRPPPWMRRWPRSTPSSTPGAARPTRSTPPSTRRRPPTTRSTSSARRFAGLLWTQADLPLRRRSLARRRQPRRGRRRASRQSIRNTHWRHLNSMRILSMPDKWEYPWFAAWDLAFHCVPLALIDPRVRQGAAVAAAVRAVPAPQRPDPRVRVGVLRSQPAGARLGRVARLQHGSHPQRARPTAPSSSAASTSC